VNQFNNEVISEASSLAVNALIFFFPHKTQTFLQLQASLKHASMRPNWHSLWTTYQHVANEKFTGKKEAW